MRIYAVIVAGGSGTRMGTEIPKQFLPIHGVPVFIHAINAFLLAFPGIKIILVLPVANLSQGNDYLQRFLPNAGVKTVEGGHTRYHSVQKGLAEVETGSVVFIHDAVRCMVSVDLIRRCYQDAITYGSSIPVVEVRDSIRKLKDGSSEVVDRSILRAVQTPQTFMTDMIQKAFQREYNPSFTDEATVLEKSGEKVHLTEGEDTNIKITFPTDLLIAEQILSKRNT